jgi:hypothetical protein
VTAPAADVPPAQGGQGRGKPRLFDGGKASARVKSTCRITGPSIASSRNTLTMASSASSRNARAAAPVPLGKNNARQDRLHAADGRRRDARMDLEAGGGRGAAHGRLAERPGPGAGHAHCAAGEEQRALDDGRLGDLDGRPCVGAAVPDAGGHHRAPDPRSQRIEAAVPRQARRLGGHEVRRARRTCLWSACRCRQRLRAPRRAWDAIVARHTRR